MSKNAGIATEWFRKAAEQESPLGQYYLGCAYEVGAGVAMDEKEAVKWFRKAAEHGIDNAELKLAFCYENGKGVPRDAVEAVRWYRGLAWISTNTN